MLGSNTRPGPIAYESGLNGAPTDGGAGTLLTANNVAVANGVSFITPIPMYWGPATISWIQLTVNTTFVAQILIFSYTGVQVGIIPIWPNSAYATGQLAGNMNVNLTANILQLKVQNTGASSSAFFCQIAGQG